MEFSYFDRAQAMLPGSAEEALIDSYADELEGWVDTQAELIRSLGWPRLTRAVLFAGRGSRDCPPYMECSFYGERGSCWTVRLLADGVREFSDGMESSVLDQAAAHHAMAALLGELQICPVLA